MMRKTDGGGIRKLEDAISLEEGFNTGALNPEWLEWFMGYPIGWTDIRRSATPSSRKSRKRSAE